MTFAQSDGVQAHIEALLEGPQYQTPAEVKRAQLFPILVELVGRMRAACAPYDRFLAGYGFDISRATRIDQIPPLPVTSFKDFELIACPRDQIVRVLTSSGTTQQIPSRISLDRSTLHRQARALMSILREALGTSRRPYLVLDVPESTDPTKGTLGARGAAIRGLATAASETVYGLKLDSGTPVVNWEAIETFCAKHRHRPVLVSGFTFLIWSQVVPALERAGRSLGLEQAHVLHSGGWKALKAERVSKEIFSEKTAEWIGCNVADVCDFYGMVEQVGTIFLDCRAGNKHPPSFATVLIRDPLTMSVVGPGHEGIIEVVSVLPSSYPGQLLLTEDQGTVVHIDDCPCGRKDIAFRFTSRIEGVELRGCGDTLARTLRGSSAP